MRRAVGIVLQTLHLGRHVEPVALEIDLAIKSLVASAPATGGDPTVAVAALCTVLGLGQGLDGVIPGQPRVVALKEPLAGSDGSGLYNWHRVYCFDNCGLDEVDLSLG